MKTIPYTPLTPWQVELFRSFLPHIVVWLRQREIEAKRAPSTAFLISDKARWSDIITATTLGKIPAMPPKPATRAA